MKDIGLVLSGGMAKGAYQIGALKAICEYIQPQDFKCISCSSIGTLNGYAFMNGKLPIAESLWKNVCCDNSSRILVTKLMRSGLVQHSINDIYSPEDKITQSFYISLMNINKKTITYHNIKNTNQELLPLYLNASIAMPIYNHPVKIKNTHYYDGAIIDNIPVHPLLQYKLDYIICIYFDDSNYQFENIYFDNKIIKITFPTKSRLKKSVIFEKNSIEEMLEQGYKTASYILESIFSKGIDDIEYIYYYILLLNQQIKEKNLRITGDVIVTNINKVTQKLAKKKIIT